MRPFTKVIIVLLIVLLLAVILLVAAIVFPPGSPGEIDSSKLINVNVTASVRVMDAINNTPVIGAPVYFAACSPNRTSNRDIHMEGTTGYDGVILFSTNYTLDEGDVIYLGASNRKPLVEVDVNSKKFNGSGYLGTWKSFNYSMLYTKEDLEVILGCVIDVDIDSGKMI